MAGHMASRNSLSHEEKLALLEERSASDLDSEGSHADFTSRFRDLTSLNYSKLDQKIPDAPALARGALRAFFSIPWRLLALRGLIFLVPSFLQSTITGEKRGRPERMHPTAYLDGMRGLAALFVYFCHYTYQAFIIAEGWGSRETNYHWLKLPYFRLWYQGPPMVCVFFVISGYALSLKPLKQMRSRSFGDFAGTMSSLTFRRGIRLYLPTAISTLMVVFLLRMGAYEITRDFANDRTYMKNIVEPHAPRLETTSEQLWSWARDMFNFIHVFGWDKYGGNVVNLDVHLWTIPVEFRCSMYLFLVLIATARLRTWIRLTVLTGVMAFTYYNSHWELVLFYCGMMIAELDLIRGAHNQHVSSPSSGSILGSPMIDEKPQTDLIVKKMKTVFWTAFSFFALYLMNQPDGIGEITPGWVYLSSLIPKWWKEEQYRYWQSIGSILFVFAVGYSPMWQRFFNTSVVQYFGKISYAIYLMHGPVMHTAGYMIEKWAYGLTGVEGYWYNGGFILGFTFAVPTVVWAADIFWRAVDIPTVKFAKWVEEKCIVKMS